MTRELTITNTSNHTNESYSFIICNSEGGRSEVGYNLKPGEHFSFCLSSTEQFLKIIETDEELCHHPFMINGVDVLTKRRYDIQVYPKVKVEF